MSLLSQEDKDWTEYFKCGLISAEENIITMSFGLLASDLLRQPTAPFAFSAARASGWLIFSFWSTSTPGPFHPSNIISFLTTYNESKAQKFAKPLQEKGGALLILP